MNASLSYNVTPALPVRDESAERAISYLNYDINEGCLIVAVKADYKFNLQMKICQTGLFGSRTETLIFDRQISQGKHTFAFGENVLPGFGRNYLAVLVNGKLYYIQRL